MSLTSPTIFETTTTPAHIASLTISGDDSFLLVTTNKSQSNNFSLAEFLN